MPARNSHRRRGQPRSRWTQAASLRQLAIELVTIVVGVLLALALNEWRDTRNERLQAETALRNVAAELESNLQILETLHANNRATVELLSSQSGELSADEDGGRRNFTPGLQLRETAWSTLLNTGVANRIEYDKLLVLSSTYAVQKIYKQTGSQLLAAWMNMAAFAAVQDTEIADRSIKRQFVDTFRLLVSIEEELQRNYRKALSAVAADS